MRLFLMFVALRTWAQVTTGQIDGYVFDPSHGPVPHAEVVARHAERGFARTVFTDAAGFYQLTALPPAVYTVTASAQGFAPATAPASRLHVNSRLRVDLTLALAERREAIEVPSTVTLLPAESSELGAVLDQPRI